MSGLEILGLFCLLFVAFFVPRMIVPILMGILLGGVWWFLLVPLSIVGLILDFIP
jgi:uncharacterized SAM-binding protein YcdF (DUF218 family)